MKKIKIAILLSLILLASTSLASADCWIGGTYTLDANAQAAELFMLPDGTKVMDLAVPAAQFNHTFVGMSDLTGKTFFIRQTFVGGITNDSAAMAATNVIPATIDHLLGGCQ